MHTISKVWLFCLLLAMSTAASANLTIEITRGSDQALPIGVVPFEGAEGMPEDVAQIIHDNLERSGFFDPLDRSSMFEQPSEADDVEFSTWRSLDVRYLVVGQAERTDSGYRLQYDLMDISGQTRMMSETVTASEGDLRGAAHYISDQIFEEITDIRGAFSTRIAYVTAQGVGDNTDYGLYVADADGRNSQQILTSDQPILSPAWSPDGGKLAYVSFENGQPEIYIQEVDSGNRARITSFEGINGAPVWSPNGRRLAMSLSKDGQPEIYIMEIGDRSLTRVTDNNSIDTEPAWSPDGNRLLFTSDRSGGPQIYEHNLRSGETERMTFTGNYNARARFSPDGEELFLIHRSDRGFQVARQNIESGRLVTLSDSTQDESPSVAPNGTMVIFATQQGNNGVLSAVSADGRSSFRLPAAQGDVRDPAWSPFLNE